MDPSSPFKRIVFTLIRLLISHLCLLSLPPGSVFLRWFISTIFLPQTSPSSSLNQLDFRIHTLLPHYLTYTRRVWRTVPRLSVHVKYVDTDRDSESPSPNHRQFDKGVFCVFCIFSNSDGTFIRPKSFHSIAYTSTYVVLVITESIKEMFYKKLRIHNRFTKIRFTSKHEFFGRKELFGITLNSEKKKIGFVPSTKSCSM